ncbi:MAG: helix-turn-helix domain-containing protein [Planctomycetaceae bacterium]|nr:helix-turn-helix domain-containing protein [Planctomycetaceae bacterium]
MNIQEYLKLGGISQTDFAKKVGVTQSFVSQWLSGYRPVPATKVVAIEKATIGLISRYDLRPDVFPIEDKF